MADAHTEFGTTEEEIFEELRIRNELAPIASFDEYLAVIDEIIEEKLSFGELSADEDTEQIKDRLARRFDELNADVMRSTDPRSPDGGVIDKDEPTIDEM